MRERLIDILLDGVTFTDEYKLPAREQAEYVADRLLENGVIVPPCKIGDKIFIIITKRPKNNFPKFSFIKKSRLSFLNMERVIADFGKTVFLTREEAEKALARMKGEGDGDCY